MSMLASYKATRRRRHHGKSQPMTISTPAERTARRKPRGLSPEAEKLSLDRRRLDDYFADLELQRVIDGEDL